MPEAKGTYQVLYTTDPERPKDQWEVYRTQLTDDPQYIQEMYVRRPNWDQEWYWKQNGSVGNRYWYTMRKTPEDEDYILRMSKREDYKPFMEHELPRYYYAELVDGNILFYESEFNAIKNKRSTMPFQRFLRVQLGYREDRVASICETYGIEYANDFVLKIATTEEEILAAYRYGPRSCMAGDDVHAQQQLRAYANGIIGVAYLHRKDDPENVVARVLVNTATKERITTGYGCTTQLYHLMDKDGWTRNDQCMIGQKLNNPDNLINTEGYPYFDFYHNESRRVVNPETGISEYWIR